MSKTSKYLMLAAVALAFFVGLAVAGVYIGGRLFAALQKLPANSVTLTTLHDYWQLYQFVPKVKRSLLAGITTAIAVPVVPFGLMLYVALSPAAVALHGAARWATDSEIRRSGLTGKPNSKWPPLVLAKKGGKWLMYHGKEFINLASATQGGKGVGFVIPNLLTYPHSIINLDLKLENWMITAGFRARHGQACYLFAPGQQNFRSHRFNPLAYVRHEYEFRVGDIQNQAVMWLPIKTEKDRFFAGNAQTLFLGLCLYMMETPGEEFTMPNMVRLATPDTGETLSQWIERTIRAREDSQSPAPRLSVECVNALRSYSSVSDKAQGDILGTFMEPLKIFRDPVLAAATSGNDFDLREVRRQKMSIYLGMTAEDLLRYHVLMNVFFSLAINLNTKTLPEQDSSLKYQCLLLLDEFTALGTITIIRRAISIMAGFNMRLALIYQNNSQLAGKEDGYGEEGAKTLLSNCTTKLLYQPDDLRDAEEYSKILGTYTMKNKSRSRQSDKPGRGENETDQKRALMMEQELRELGFERVIVLKKNTKPILADKIIYHSDPAFKDRANLPTPHVPVLNIVKSVHRDRAMLPDELATTDVDDIVNSQEILDAIGAAIGFDFAAFAAKVVKEENSVAQAA